MIQFEPHLLFNWFREKNFPLVRKTSSVLVYLITYGIKIDGPPRF